MTSCRHEWRRVSKSPAGISFNCNRCSATLFISWEDSERGLVCADCHTTIGCDDGPKDGWQLEDGRTVCQACCVKDTAELVVQIVKGVNNAKRS